MHKVITRLYTQLHPSGALRIFHNCAPVPENGSSVSYTDTRQIPHAAHSVRTHRLREEIVVRVRRDREPGGRLLDAVPRQRAGASPSARAPEQAAALLRHDELRYSDSCLCRVTMEGSQRAYDDRQSVCLPKALATELAPAANPVRQVS